MLAHPLLNDVDLSEDLYSELFKVLINAFLVRGIGLLTYRQLSDSSNELSVFRKWPMPEYCLAVCILNLRNRNEVFALKCLIDNTVIAFKGAVSSGWIGA